MAKQIQIHDEDDELFDPATSVQKLPYDIQRGRKAMTDFIEVPVGQVIPFRGKGSGDFSRMNPEDFEQFVATIRRDGIIEPVTIRAIDSDEFELLAGETRYRGALAANLDVIPAHLIRDCDDEKAMRIFTLTNINRRKATTTDLLYGCYMYWSAIKDQDGDKASIIKADYDDAGLGATPGNLRLRQIQKYYKIYPMGNPFLTQIENGTLAIDAAYAIAFLQPDERTMIAEEHYTIRQANQLKLLSQQGLWSKEAVDKILRKGVALATISPPNTTMNRAVKRFKTLTKTKLRPERWDAVDNIMTEAMQLYFAKHPEDLVTE